MKAEIFRKLSAKPDDQKFASWMLTGRQRVGEVTTDHASSNYGQPVVVVKEWGGIVDYAAIESIDLIGASDVELQSIKRSLEPMGIKVSISSILEK